MSIRQIHVFISHAWDHAHHYDTLADWIFKERWSVGQASLDFRDFSVPQSDPIHNAPNSQALQDAIFDKISRSHVIVIPTGMYATYSAWIKKEIAGAKQYAKPILAVTPWGQERESGIVLDNADRSVGWNKESVIGGLWDLYYARNR